MTGWHRNRVEPHRDLPVLPTGARLWRVDPFLPRLGCHTVVRSLVAFPTMSGRFILLLVLALSVAACGDGSGNTTTTAAVSTTAETLTTTAPQGTGAIETTTTTAGTTTTTNLPAVAVIDIVVDGGTVERVERFDVALDGTVRMTVTADVSDEVHVHGYDIHADVAPGQAAVFEFDATIPGVFEVEMEGSGVLIGELQVAP